jgi:hypothetical protein
MQERMLFSEALDTVKLLEEGVLTSVADANIGSIFGIGFPGWTGGVLQYINGYEGGLPGFVARARELAERYGERFTPPALLVEKAEKGERFAGRHVRAQQAVPRTQEPSDLVSTLLYVVDEGSAFLTGQTLNVAGGSAYL